MIQSKVGICNQALAAIGEDAIRDLTDGNVRARMCDVFYDTTRNYLLSQFDWPFARKQMKLTQLAVPQDWTPEGIYAYSLPSDCHQPLDLFPEGSMQNFEIRGQELYCSVDSTQSTIPVVLIYTRYEENPTKFSAQFANLLSIALAVRICPSISQDKELVKTLFGQYEMITKEAWGTDANIGNKHLHNNDNPALDSFVDPDFSFTGGNL